MHGKLLPLSAQQLQEIFDDFLGTQLAMPNSVTPYALALRSSRLEQEWVLEWLKILRREYVIFSSEKNAVVTIVTTKSKV